MMHLVMLFALTAAAVLQAIIPAWILFGMAKVPLMLGVVLYYALVRDRNTMLQAAFLGGFFQDALGMMPLGTSSCCFCLVAALINHFRELIFVRQLITHVMFGALVNLGVTTLLFFLLIMGRHVEAQTSMILMKLLGALILGAVVVPLVFHAMESLERRIGCHSARDF